jgi:ketosteroid isomerase-like protein
MSQEGAEIVHRTVAAWNGQDLEAMLALTHPELEYVNSPTAVEPGTRSGHEAFKRVLRDQWDILSDARWEIDRVYEHGEEMVSLGRLSRGMPGSDARIAGPILVAFRFTAGKVSRMAVLGVGETEVQQALEAAGLSE